MTRRDKWAKRPCVVRYFKFRDKIRARLKRDDAPTEVHVKAYFKHQTRTGPHNQKPDIDNIIKAVLDTWKEDKATYKVSGEKWWGDEDRLEITLVYGEQ